MSTLLEDQAKAANQNKPGYDVLGNKIGMANAGDAQVLANQQAAAKLGVSIPGVGGAMNQSTTTLSSDKSKDISNIKNATNNLSQTGVTTTMGSDGNPVSTYADGSVYQPGNDNEEYDGESKGGYYGETYIPAGQKAPEGAQLTEYSPTDKAIIDSLNEQRTKNDAITAGIISNIQAQFTQFKKQQEETNRGAEAGTNKLLLRNGGLQHTGSGGQVLSAQVSYGISQMADLANKEQMAILSAKQAGQDMDFKLMDRINKEIQDTRDKKIAIANKINNDLAEANKKAAEQKYEEQRELIKSVQNITNTAIKNGAPTEVINAINNAKSETEAMAYASEYLHSEEDKLDLQYKKLQMDQIRANISKTYAEMAKDKLEAQGGGQDPSAMIAYAQEYAANGKIPTGLPKGSFGVVAQIAKEMPKTPGQIVSVSTGVAPAGDDTYQSGLAALYSATELAKQLKVLEDKRYEGIVSGTLGKIFGSEDQQRYLDLRSQIVDLLSRARSGAALTPSEEQRYGDMLPGRFSDKLFIGVDSQSRIDNFINTLNSDATNKASSKGWAINGVSKVKVGKDEYVVGDVIELEDGTMGRINANSSITYLN